MTRVFAVFSVLISLVISCRQEALDSVILHKSIPQERMAEVQQDVAHPPSRRSQAGIGYGNARSSDMSPAVPGRAITKLGDIATQQTMLIKQAIVRFEVNDYHAARENIGRIIGTFDAYISSERETRSEQHLSNNMTIRIHADQFDALIDSLAAQSRNLDEKSVTLQDVTEEFVDVQTRLTAKRRVEERYLEILKRANTVKDILEVEQKLGQIREEIETTEGRLKYLSHQVSHSTVTLSFYEQKSVFPRARIGFPGRVARSFMRGWAGLIEFILVLIAVWPFVLIVLVIGFSVNTFLRRLKRKGNRSPAS